MHVTDATLNFIDESKRNRAGNMDDYNEITQLFVALAGMLLPLFAINGN